MRGDVTDGMEGARLRPLVPDGDVAQDRDERLGLVMRLCERARTRQRRERSGNFFSGHNPGSNGCANGEQRNSVPKVYLTVPNLFV